MHPTYLGWQVDWPVFVKQEFHSNGKVWKRMAHYPWAEMGLDEDKVASLYNSGFIYHNKQLEVQTKVGDRLGEMTVEQTKTLVNLLNAEVKKNTNSNQEYASKKCKSSSILNKQRGLIRRFLNQSRWIQDDFYKFRDQILEGGGN